MKNIILTGYRGSGKTTISKILSKKLELPVFCLDKEIEKFSEMKIEEIVNKYGWDKFREIESKVAKKASLLKNYIIDTGGGIITRKENVKNLSSSGIVFWLKADVDVLRERIENKEGRPALTEGKTFVEEIKEVLEEREPKYNSFSDHIIDASLPLEKQINKIIKIYEQSR